MYNPKNFQTLQEKHTITKQSQHIGWSFSKKRVACYDFVRFYPPNNGNKAEGCFRTAVSE